MEPLVKPGETVDVQELKKSLGGRRNSLLVKTADVEIVHLVIPAGETIPTHEAQGEIVLHCLEGRALVSALGEAIHLDAGQLFYFAVNEPFSIEGIDEASLLATIIVPKQGPAVELIGDRAPCEQPH